jgi:hypothetical protein
MDDPLTSDDLAAATRDYDDLIDRVLLTVWNDLIWRYRALVPERDLKRVSLDRLRRGTLAMHLRVLVYVAERGPAGLDLDATYRALKGVTDTLFVAAARPDYEIPPAFMQRSALGILLRRARERLAAAGYDPPGMQF